MWLSGYSFCDSMAMYELLGIIVVAWSVSVASSSEAIFQFAVVVSESEDTSSFYGGGAANETQSAVALALQHISSCPNILHFNLSLETIFIEVS